MPDYNNTLTKTQQSSAKFVDHAASDESANWLSK